MQLQKDLTLLSKVSPIGQITEGQQYIINKNLDALIQMSLKDAQEFQSTQLSKLKALQQLKMICCIVDVSKHLTAIYQTISKLYSSEDNYFIHVCNQICFVIGLKIDQLYYLPTLINQTKFELQSQSTKRLCNLLQMITESIVHEQDTLDLQNLIQLLIEVEQIYSDNLEVIQSVYQLTEKIVVQSSRDLPIYIRQIFQILLTVRSFGKINCDYLLNQLAVKCGYASVSDLHANEVHITLEQVLQQNQHKTWKHNSREFLKFKAIVLGCGDGVGRYIQSIVEILRFSLIGDQEVELRLECLLLLDSLIKQINIDQLKTYAAIIITQLLLQCLVWKANKPTVKVRKAAVIITLSLVDMLQEQEIADIFQPLTASLKTCLTDDWAPDLRYASSCLATKLIQKCNILNYENIRDFYPALLERLDDSQNQIRIEITKAIAAIMKQKYDSTTILEYIVKATLIHLDDSSEEVQKAVFDCLSQCPSKEILLKEAENVVKNFKYPRPCQELIKLVSQQ